MLVVSSYCDWNSSTINIKDQLTWDVNQLERSMDFSNKSSIGLICLSTWGILSFAWLWLLRLLFLFYVYCLLKSFLRQFEWSRASISFATIDPWRSEGSRQPAGGCSQNKARSQSDWHSEILGNNFCLNNILQRPATLMNYFGNLSGLQIIQGLQGTSLDVHMWSKYEYIPDKNCLSPTA